jgi:hypothetical protein
MERQRNLLPLAGFLVCLAAFLSYFVFFYRFPLTRDMPWVSWLLFALGLGLLVAGLRRPYRQPERFRGRVMGPVLGVLSLAVAGIFVFATTVGSRELPPAQGAPRVGQKAPDFVVQDPDGRPVRLYDLLGSEAGGTGAASWVVLVFYRGYW